MWSKVDIQNLESLLPGQTDLSLFLDDEEIDVVKGLDEDGVYQNLTRYLNLRNAVFKSKNVFDPAVSYIFQANLNII